MAPMEDTLRGDATAAYSHARSAVMKPQSICDYKAFVEKISLHSPDLGYREVRSAHRRRFPRGMQPQKRAGEPAGKQRAQLYGD